MAPRKARTLLVSLAGYVLLLTAILASAVPASAQEPLAVSVAITDLTAPIAFDSSSTLSFTVVAGCAAIVAAAAQEPGTEPHAHVAMVATKPEWLDVTVAGIDFDPADCGGGTTGSVSATATATMMPKPMAPGLTTGTVTLTGTMENYEEATGEDSSPVKVAYKPGFAFSTDVSFPLEYGSLPITLNATFTVSSNARTMVMIETVTPANGTMVGFPSPKEYDSPYVAGNTETTDTFLITYTPDPNTTVDIFEFRVYSHSLDDPSQTSPVENVTWTFARNQTAPVSGGGGGGGGGLPGPGPMLSLAAVVAGVFVATRRRGAA